MLEILQKTSSNDIIVLIILFILQFFIILIYLEIIELNFCGLNKNTKRKIQIRANNEMNFSESRDRNLSILSNDENEPGYYTKIKFGEIGPVNELNDLVDEQNIIN